MPVFFTAHPMPAKRAASKAGFTASSVFLMPTPGPSTCPVPNASPTSSALSHRICHRSRPTCSASRSTMPSRANITWLTPKPRIAPHGTLFV